MAKRTVRTTSATVTAAQAGLSHSEDVRRRLGKNVRAARTHLGMTQVQVCERSGISQKTLSDIELGKANCTIAQMTRIAQVMDLDVEHLLKPEPRKPLSK